MVKNFKPILHLAVAFLNSDAISLLSFILKYGRKLIGLRIHEGMYEVLDYQSTLELLDAKGHIAILHKTQHVRFLQDNIIAYQDKAWGDGEIFYDYKISIGEPVDIYRDGHRFNILISLRGTKQRGDEEKFHIQRTIKNGFTQNREDFQTDIDHQTRKLSLSIIFPSERLPKRISIIEQNTSRTHILNEKHMTSLPDQRIRYTWTTDKPTLFEAYVMRWEF